MKDTSLVAAVERLRSRFGPDAFVVRDRWKEDRYAIGLAARDEPERLVRLSTRDRPAGRYGVSLELPSTAADTRRYATGAHWPDVDFEGVATLVAEHLGLRGSRRRIERSLRPDDGRRP